MNTHMNGNALLHVIGELDESLITEAAEPMAPLSRKKGIFVRRMAVIAAAVLLLCGLGVGIFTALSRRELGVSSEKVPLYNTTGLVEPEKLPLCVTDDLEEFVTHWQATHAEQGMDFLVVPVCKTDEFIFVRAHENEYYYFYRFMPTGTVSDSSGISPSLYDVGIEISLSKSDGSYAAVLDQFGLTDRGGKAFYAHGDQSKIWYINYSGHCLSVRFFHAAPLQDPEDFRTVSDLFEFLVFTEDSMPTLPEKETATEPPDTDIP